MKEAKSNSSNFAEDAMGPGIARLVATCETGERKILRERRRHETAGIA
jgi:hypothetical protein